MDAVIAVDASTTGSKAVAFDAQGNVLAIGRRTIDRDSPQATWHEQDALQWWASTAAAIREVTETLAAQGHTPVALGITHQRESFVCLDAEYRPLRPAILWLDARSGDEVRRLGTPRVHELSGKPPSTTPSFYKLAWLARYEPEVMAATAHIAEVHACLSYRLTGEFATSTASADPMGLMDVRTGDWSEELLALVGVSRNQLPRLVAPGQLIGTVHDDASRLTGLPTGLPVVAGGGDGQCAGLGAGVVRSGKAYLSLGTSITLGCYADSVAVSRGWRVLASPLGHGVTTEAFIATGALSVSWFRKAFPQVAVEGDVDVYDTALETCHGSGLYFLPYLSGSATPYWDDKSRGAFVGVNESHDWVDFYRSVLEGLAFETQLLLEQLESASDPITDVVVMGGGAASGRWLQILADVTGRPLRVSTTTEATALGAGILAAAYCGLVPGGVEAAAAAMAHTEQVFVPRDAQMEAYAQRFSVYRTIYGALKPVFDQSFEVERALGGFTQECIQK
ncbi:xylulokinase [Psychromicrobium xiongbiense]|uniref:xylulokinase n=1 Tax=Psychromicrobium xiongbiense TaxID=3051184 RepID=UPI0025565607|nr:FGGY family carbohydrate kinase [Psychromicrobium sp. YIM S02556]